MKENSKNIHAGHRERVKKRFLKEKGLDNFEEHNILELLLFFGIPFKDTNETAHRLLERFGSISRMMDALPEDIMQVEGVGENAMILIKLIPSLCKVYMHQKNEIGAVFDNVEKLGRMFVDKYSDVNVETVYLMLLDNSYREILTEKIFEGSVNSAQISPRKLAEITLLKNASMVVLAHNHPNGIAIPSFDDLETTTSLVRLFDSIGAPMLEHILVAGKSYTPILYNQLGERRLLPDNAALASKIDILSFYGKK